MHFEYEITADDYVAAQRLYYKLRLGHKRIADGVFWILAGCFLLVVAWNHRSIDLTPLVLGIIGSWWIWVGIYRLFPAKYLRHAYRTAKLGGKKFEASMGEDYFEVVGEFCTWRIKWPGVSLKGENNDVFVFYAENYVFIFGKKYLNNAEQDELRRLIGI